MVLRFLWLCKYLYTTTGNSFTTTINTTDSGTITTINIGTENNHKESKIRVVKRTVV